MDERIVFFADAATTALTSDRELRLLLRAQVIAHATKRAHVYLSAGNTWEESVGRALRDLGAPELYGKQVLLANAAMVQQRVRTRRWLWLLMLATALVFVWVQLVGCMRILRAVPLVTLIKTDQLDNTSLSPVLSRYFPFQPAKQRRAAFLFLGDTTRATMAEQHRAIWEANPRNKVYFASYVRYLLMDGSKYPQDLTHFRHEMQLGMQLDPKNAFYHYLLADALTNQALDRYSEAITTDKQTGKLFYSYQIKDRRLLEEAMRELRLAVTRPEFNTYHTEMLQAQFALLPTPRYFEDYFLRLTLSANELMPEQKRYRALAHVIPYFAHVLAAEGRRGDAEVMLHAWLPMTTHLTANSHTLIEILVAGACEKIAGNDSAGVYDELGEHKRAQQLRAQTARISEPLDKHKSAMHNDHIATQNFLCEYGALHVDPVLPIFGKWNFTRDELTPTRTVEYILLETVVASIILPLLLILLLYASLAGLRWGMSEEESNTPFIALLPVKTLLRVLGYGVLLPLALYYFHTRWSGLAGHEHSMFATFFLPLVEMIVLAFVLLILPAQLAKRAIRRHCEELGIPVPPRRYQRLRGFFSGVWRFMWVALFVLSVTRFFHLPMPPVVANILDGGLLSLFVFLLLLTSVLLPGLLKWRHPYGHFFGIVAKTLVPIYALSLLLIGMLTFPYLAWSEQHWLRQDRLIYAHPGSADYPSPIEQRVVSKLSTQMLVIEKSAAPSLSK